MKDFNLINKIQIAVAVIGKDMTVAEANEAFTQRNKLISGTVVGSNCFNAAYKFNEGCTSKTNGLCPVTESFKTKKPSSVIHHFWIDDDAVVEEITTTPIVEENGEVNYVVEEFRDITKLLGLQKGIIAICSYCRKIRDDGEQWVPIESYIKSHTGANFSHGICDECSQSMRNKNQA